MKFKHEENYTLTTTDYIGKAFSHIPFNAFIDKGRCGNGANTLETDDKTRSTITVVPTKGVIEDKTVVQELDDAKEVTRKESIFPVNKDTTDQQILEYLTLDVVGKKIMVIPDNFKKIINVATKHNMLKELYRDYFLLIDESHSAVTEEYRDAITVPFDYFWEFLNKSVISATPFYFSDPRFQELELHKIRFKNPSVEETYINEIKVIEAKNVYATLHRLIATTQGNLHIFLNSVAEMTRIIEHGKLDYCHVYCNGKEKNIIKLGLRKDCFKPQPINGKYAKVNFYTTRYFEGWDLKDDNATLILVTNIYQTNTKVGISNKGVQALGRIRTKNHQLIHITNHKRTKSMKTLDQIQKEYLLRASQQVEKYNAIVTEYKSAGILPTEEEQSIIKNYADIDEETQFATLKNIKVDQIINKQVCAEQFNDISFIKEVWRKAGFDVIHQKSSLSLISSSSPEHKRLSKTKRFEAVVTRIAFLYEDKANNLFNNSDDELSKIKTEWFFEFEAYHLLGIDVLKTDNFNYKIIQKKLTMVKNLNSEVKLLRLLKNEFEDGKPYTKVYIKDKLQELYKLVGIEKVATAEQLGDRGRFDLNECKIRNANGRFQNGFVILRPQFELMTAA